MTHAQVRWNKNVCRSLFFVDPDEFDRIYEPLDVKSKKIHIVDSGLTYNLPYPLILRPQRGVDLIISFDFSARPSDSSPPFKVRKPLNQLKLKIYNNII